MIIFLSTPFFLAIGFAVSQNERRSCFFFVSTNEEQDLAEEDFFSLFEAVAKHIFVVVGGLFVSSPT